MSFPKETLFVIECRTGCTCCSSENHYRGFYKTREDAERRINSFFREDSKFWPLASQFAKRGNYSIRPREVEHLPDGRHICDDTVIGAEAFKIVTVDADGLVIDHENERLGCLSCY